MNIGIVGAGNVGSTLAKLWAKAGHKVMLSYSRSPDRLNDLAKSLGANVHTGSPLEAAAFGDVILLSTNFWMAQQALAEMGDLTGRIVLDTTNPYGWENEATASGKIVRMVSNEVSAAETLSAFATGARWVKVFSTLQPKALVASAGRSADQRVVVPFASDDQSLDVLVQTLIRDAGGQPYALGTLSKARMMEIGGTLALSDSLSFAEIDRRLGSTKLT
jgi:8-hydroxy-5-deazaflavin:NADPH oxidoreductase